jgi:poly(3-hydroxybutyrate) depolymerase
MLTALLTAAIALAADFPVGQVIPQVVCADDESQSYALFVPTTYSPDRAWPVIFAFDPGARGRTPVERYQAAAERYGFIVAGSNNSRNGSNENSKAILAMTRDVATRFPVDVKRVYLAGMSGGARVALGVALTSPQPVAGVIASSAGYPDAKPRKTLPFPIFSTAGTDDFNHLEMRRLDAALASPHRLVVFEGGHVWLSSELAIEAVEWMELQAMKARLKPRDERAIDSIFARRQAAIDISRTDKATFVSLKALAEDFDGLRDVKSTAGRVAELARDKTVRAALKRDDDEDAREERMIRDVVNAENRLLAGEERTFVLADLRRRWKDLSDAAKKPEDSTDRRLARRVLGTLSGGTSVTDPEYLKIIAEYRLPRAPR